MVEVVWHGETSSIRADLALLGRWQSNELGDRYASPGDHDLLSRGYTPQETGDVVLGVVDRNVLHGAIMKMSDAGVNTLVNCRRARRLHKRDGLLWVNRRGSRRASVRFTWKSGVGP